MEIECPAWWSKRVREKHRDGETDRRETGWRDGPSSLPPSGDSVQGGHSRKFLPTCNLEAPASLKIIFLIFHRPETLLILRRARATPWWPRVWPLGWSWAGRMLPGLGLGFVLPSSLNQQLISNSTNYHSKHSVSMCSGPGSVLSITHVSTHLILPTIRMRGEIKAQNCDSMKGHRIGDFSVNHCRVRLNQTSDSPKRGHFLDSFL